MSAREPNASKGTIHVAWRVIAESFRQFSLDAVPRLAAAFSFYAMLAMAPLLVLAIVVASTIIGDGTPKETILREVQASLGADSRAVVEQLIENTRKPGAGTLATLISLGVAFFSTTNLFIQLRETFRTIWGAEPGTVGFLRSLLVSRLISFVAVLAFGIVALAWLVLDGWLAWVQNNTSAFHNGQILSFVAASAFLTLAFGITFRFYPSGKVQWKDVWIGAAVAAVGVSAGKYVLGEYFSRIDVAGAYGPAGSLVVILLWIYYTSQIFFFGAEVVHSYAHLVGSRVQTEPVEPETYA